MAKRKNKKITKKNFIFYIIAIIIAVVAWQSRDTFLDINKNITLEEGSLGVYFVDVGQGNCTVIQSGNEGILIDTGEREYAVTVTEFLKDKGISKLKYVIATHPHSDHIGSMANVLENVEAEEIYMPYIIDKYAPTSKTYMNLLSTLNSKKVKTHFLKKNTKLSFGGAEIDIIVPVEQMNDFNNMSLITKLVYGKTSFLIPADAENKEIESILKANRNFDFSADFYLLAHHGSSTSLHKGFLKKVSPKVGVISCGLNNDYGHPHKEIVKYLKDNAITYYRTDEKGTVTVITDGEQYNIELER